MRCCLGENVSFAFFFFFFLLFSLFFLEAGLFG